MSSHTRHTADKGYVGLGHDHPPVKKPAGPPQPETDKNYNRAINKIRWQIEQVIAHLKTWHSLKPRCRRPTDTITAILGIIFTYTP
ncbi:transposase family protein [Propionibacterium acidifaciens]|uniref:transposase family protein n=1 Tax=Propionibacterium acidifaciens TaxID=556499 RepID=UPI0023F21171|nr:transposase family protein [Propionibacterium acidifaciens]